MWPSLYLVSQQSFGLERISSVFLLLQLEALYKVRKREKERESSVLQCNFKLIECQDGLEKFCLREHKMAEVLKHSLLYCANERKSRRWKINTIEVVI